MLVLFKFACKIRINFEIWNNSKLKSRHLLQEVDPIFLKNVRIFQGRKQLSLLYQKLLFLLKTYQANNMESAMEDQGRQNRHEELFSRAIRAGKRTYFFDVKATRQDEQYLTITESKRRFSNEQGKFFYEKHKLFLYREDFEKFMKGLTDSIQFIETGEVPEDYEEQHSGAQNDSVDVSFEDLDKIDDEL
jgi:hypothetical protein